VARRLGFFGRIGKALNNTVEAVEAAVATAVERVFQREPEKPRRRPPPTGGPGPGPGPKKKRAPTADDDFRRVWAEETLRRPGVRDYRRQLSFLRDLYGFERAPHDAQVDIWREFVKFNSKQRQPYLRKDSRHPFWQITGISPDNFDWTEWRALMRRMGSP
jgi:hypothetical protein